MTVRSVTRLLIFLVPLALTACNGGPGAIVGGKPLRTPTFNYGKDGGGCADIHLYKGTADRREVLWIRADKEKLELPAKGTKTFDLAAKPDGLEVGVDLWETAPSHSAYCNDIAPDTKREAIWAAMKGKITITVFEPTDNPGARPTYKVSAKLEESSSTTGPATPRR
jgi:hypothetical protein